MAKRDLRRLSQSINTSTTNGVTMAKRDLKKLLKRAAEEKRASRVWKPSKGDSISGTVTKIRHLPGRGKDPETGKAVPYMSITIADENGELVVINAGMILAEDIKDQGVEKGDDIAIIYNGKDKTGSGHEVSTYSLAVDRTPGS